MSKNEIWNKYEKKTMIGSGSYSYVYKGINKSTGIYVAIKEINKEKYMEKTKLCFQESDIMKKLNFENSISLIETYETEQNYYIIMDFCICNLEEYLKMRNECFSIYEIFELLKQLNNTFKYLYKNNLIHRDIKPSNILLSIDKVNKIKFKLSDYGTCIDLNTKNLTNTRAGTPLTMAPEILKGESFSNKCDIWSLGIVIYYMLFRNYPYNGNGEYQIIKDIESNKKLTLTNDNDLNNLILRMLTPNIDKRISWEEYFNHPFFKKNIFESESKLFEYNLKCNKHNQLMNSYCLSCKNNICELCLNEHKSHEIYPFYQIGFNKEEFNEIQNLIDEIENNFISFTKIKNNIESLIKTMKLIKNNSTIYDKDIKKNYKQYFINYLKNLNDKLLIDGNLYSLNLLENNNYIVCEYEIKDEDLNKEIQIINSFEESKRQNQYYRGEENENQIKENCQLYLNNQKKKFCYKMKFSKKGKYQIKFCFKQLLTNINYMFSDCSSLISIDLSHFNSSNVTNMRSLFYNCSSLKIINFTNFDTYNVINMRGLFYGCSSIEKLDLSHFKTNNTRIMTAMFLNCSSLKTLNLSNFDTNNVYDMQCMFYGCSSLESLNISNFNPKNVINMREMFDNCSSLSSLDLSNFNAENVTDLSGMFFKCSSLQKLDLSKINTIDTLNFSIMFSGCSSLNSLNLSSFNTSYAGYMNEMFNECSSLISLDLSNFNTNKVSNMRGMFWDCLSLESLNLNNFNTECVYIMEDIFSGLRTDCKIITKDNKLLKEFENYIMKNK